MLCSDKNVVAFCTDEVTRFALVWMTFLGATELFSMPDGHIRVGYFLTLLTGKQRKVLSIISDLLVLSLVITMVVGGIIWMIFGRVAVSAALEIPMPLVYAVLPLCGFMSAVIILWRMPRAAREAESEDWKF